jgi:hypothetical protein
MDEKDEKDETRKAGKRELWCSSPYQRPKQNQNLERVPSMDARGFNSFRVDEIWGTLTRRSRWRANAGLKDTIPLELWIARTEASTEPIAGAMGYGLPPLCG